METIKSFIKHVAPLLAGTALLIFVLWYFLAPAEACNFITIGGFRFCLPG